MGIAKLPDPGPLPGPDRTPLVFGFEGNEVVLPFAEGYAEPLRLPYPLFVDILLKCAFTGRDPGVVLSWLLARGIYDQLREADAAETAAIFARLMRAFDADA